MSEQTPQPARAAQPPDPLLSPCGLYCAHCGVLQAHQSQDQVVIGKMAQVHGCRPEDIQCEGCLSEHRFFYCQHCGIRQCAQGKGLEGCHLCGEFPCALVTEFPIEVGKQIILRNVPRWRELGTEAWLAEEARAHTCPSCGEALTRGARRCRSCGNKVIQ